MDDLRRARLFGSKLPRWADGLDLDKPAPDGRGVAHAALKTRSGIIRAVAGLETRIAELDGNQDLTNAGKTKRRAELAREVAAEIDRNYRPRVETARQKRDERRAKARPADPFDGEPVARAVTFAAVWGLFGDRLTDPLTTERLVQDALAKGDVVTAQAIMALPTAHPGALDGERLDRLEAEMIESANPELSGELAEENEILADLESALAAAEQYIADAAGEASAEAA